MSIDEERYEQQVLDELETAAMQYLASVEQEQRERDDESMYAGMRDWFLSNYCDPAEETPFESVEGGYIWIWGGPYEPGAVLMERFGEIADHEQIDRLANELRLTAGLEWAPRRPGGYDDRFEVEVGDSDAPLLRLRERLAKGLRALDLHGDESAMGLVPSLIYGAAISSLEAFLYETVMYWVEGDDNVLRSIVTKLPALKDQPMKLGEIFQQYEELRVRVKGHLQNIIWHQWDKVAQLFIHGFGFNPPTFKPFEDALLRRHDIVHRSGHDKEGNPVAIARVDVFSLALAIDGFAQQLCKQTIDRALREGEEPMPNR